MMKVSVCALAMLFAAGCVCTKECTKDSDCGPEGMCPSEYQFCVVRPDAGATTLDSGMTAGDSGQPTGDAGDQIDAGRDSGVSPGLWCPHTVCQSWEYCEEGLDAGACRAYRVEIASPSEGEVFDAGAAVLVGVIARFSDGGESSVVVPVVTNYGLDAGVTSNSSPKSFALPPKLGHFTFTAGWPESAKPEAYETVGVDTRSCEVSCADWQECIANVDGGTCVSAEWVVTWVTPASGLETNQSPVPAQVSVTNRDGGPVGVSSVPVATSDGGTVMFMKTGPTFTGDLVLPSEGTHVFLAGWPGEVRPALSVKYDITAPVVQVTAIARNAIDAGVDGEPGFEGHWKRDEKPLVKVDVTGGRVAMSSDLSNGWGGAVAEVPSAHCGCVASTCRCFAVDVLEAPLNAIRVNGLGLNVAPISDAAGNASAPGMTSLKVTRFKWARALGDSVTTLFPVAVSEQGLVMAVASERIRAFNQKNGAEVWSVTDAGILTTGVTVGSTTAFVAKNLNSSSALIPIALSNGQIGNSRCVASNTTFVGDLALGTSATGEAPFGIRNGVLSAGFDPCPIRTLGNQSGRPSVAILEEAGNVVDVFSTSDAFSASVLPNLFKTTLSGTVWTPEGTSPFPLTSPTSRPVAGIFLDGTHVGGTSQDGIYTTSSAGTLGAVTVVASSPNLRPAAVGVGYVIYGDSIGQLTKQVYTGGVYGTKTVVAVATGEELSSPILAAGDRVFAVGSKGTIVARRTSDLQGGNWVGPFVDPVSSVGHPALDVYRKSDGSPDCSVPLGVLYVASLTGNASYLTAIYVDSKGLDPSAPWPKYQRDNANTGNISRSLDPWTCP